MADLEFYVDIENATTGLKLGSGPLASVERWQYTARFDRAGTVGFVFSANDPQADIVQNRRVARAYALLNGAWTEVGAGRIDNIDTALDAQGRVSLNASGLDLLVELGDRNVGSLEIGAGSGEVHAAALTAIGALAPAGWTFIPEASPDNDFVYARYGGESVLGALIHLAERTQTHFYRSANRTVVFTSSFADSGIRAIQATGNLAAETCAITNLKRTVDTHDLLTRISPYGSGQGNARLTLAATSRSAPVGYTLSAASNYIENTSATSTYGLVNHPEVEFKEITPISNTDADLQAAANMLFDAALEELRRRSSLASQETYNISIAGCSELLRPLQTIRVIYRDTDQGIDIDEDLYILEATWEVDASGARTSKLIVSTDDRWPANDASAAADRAVEGRVFQAHPQLNANSWWENATLYVGDNQTDHIGEFPFVLGNETVTVNQVLFRYKVSSIMSFTSTVAGSSTSSGASSASSSAGGSAHDHDIPDHAHRIIVSNGTAARAITGGVAGGNILLSYGGVSAGDLEILTIPDTPDVATSQTENSHTHNIDHTHTFTPTITTTYGIYKESGANTYTLANLEYRINGGSWVSLDTGVLTSASYYELDITASVCSATTFRPNQENNLIEIRRKTAAGTGKTAMIYAKLGVRTTIQAVAFL